MRVSTAAWSDFNSALVRRIAAGGLAAMSRAMACAVASISAAGHISVTKPSAAAVAASNGLARSTRSAARAWPSIFGSRYVEPASGTSLIEATIAEVTLTDDLEYGVQWFFQSGNSKFNLNETLPVRAFPDFAGFSYLFSTADARVTLNAIASVTDLNIISSPSLMVLDNQTAEIQVGDQVPVATRSAVGVTADDAPVVNEIEYLDTGVILRVTPRVNTGGLVTMEIEQEVSFVADEITSGIDSPTIDQRRIQTTVAVQSGETVALGGLIRDDRSSSNSGVPLLREIPVLGKLFSTTTDFAARTELIVLITPRVVRSQLDARQVTEELRRRMRAVAPLDDRLY